ncbi:hypothetical protein CEXT_239741 [Caerostris extrusa]|uniref:Mitochondrial inner membrane protease subunit 2 n=1 Tax=Caerostris extrusa TaxID=172846 RepID=A0AAV4WFA0_CAEEX|nr:hypothetical protein CEXT_239741 [Caerostris extrusa]
MQRWGLKEIPSVSLPGHLLLSLSSVLGNKVISRVDKNSVCVVVAENDFSFPVEHIVGWVLITHPAVANGCLRVVLNFVEPLLTSLCVLRSPRDPDELIKRVIAVEGDTVKASDMLRYVSIPAGHCWVEGDHTAHSMDSNYFGPGFEVDV